MGGPVRSDLEIRVVPTRNVAQIGLGQVRSLNSLPHCCILHLSSDLLDLLTVFRSPFSLILQKAGMMAGPMTLHGLGYYGFPEDAAVAE